MSSNSPMALTVYRGTNQDKTYVWSPFVIKLEARLRFAEIPYTTEAGSLSIAPRGKIPYVSMRTTTLSSTPAEQTASIGDAAELMSDSTLIIKRFVSEGRMTDLNAGLSKSDQTKDLALRALMEEKLYFYGTYEKWHENYYAMREGVLTPSIPFFPARYIIGLLAYRKNMTTIQGQGTLRYTPAEIQSFREEIWSSLAHLLVDARDSNNHDDKGGATSKTPFWALGGIRPTEFDATLYGFLVSALVCTAAPETMRIVRSHPSLMDYVTRIHDRYFTDYEGWDV